MRHIASVAAFVLLSGASAFSQTSSPSPAPEVTPTDILTPTERAAAPFSSAPLVTPIPLLDEGFKPKPFSAITENAARHSEWRQLKNLVANDPELKAALRTAESARTDLVKRKLLRDYYQLYFARMDKLAVKPETKAYLEAQKQAALNGMAQPRVRPTSTPSPTPTPTPIPPPPQPPLPVDLPSPSESPPN